MRCLSKDAVFKSFAAAQIPEEDEALVLLRKQHDEIERAIAVVVEHLGLEGAVHGRDLVTDKRGRRDLLEPKDAPARPPAELNDQQIDFAIAVEIPRPQIGDSRAIDEERLRIVGAVSSVAQEPDRPDQRIGRVDVAIGSDGEIVEPVPVVIEHDDARRGGDFEDRLFVPGVVLVEEPGDPARIVVADEDLFAPIAIEIRRKEPGDDGAR